MEPEIRDERGWICSFLGSGSTVAFMHLFLLMYLDYLPLIQYLELTASIYLGDLECLFRTGFIVFGRKATISYWHWIGVLFLQ